MVVGLLSPPVVTWLGPADRTLRFRVVDSTRGTPVAGARVALVHPYDPEQSPIESETDTNGQVELRGQFRRFGGTDCRGHRVTYFTYEPWGVEARAEGYKGYLAPLGEMSWVTSGISRAHEPLNSETGSVTRPHSVGASAGT